MTSPRILVYTSEQSVRWGDMDAQGHVNNVVYFRYMEQCRSEWMFSHGEGSGHKSDVGSVIVNASCEFLAPLLFPATIEVRMFLSDLGRSSARSQYEIWNGTTKVATGAAKIVWILRSTGRSHPVPDVLTAELRAATSSDSTGRPPATP